MIVLGPISEVVSGIQRLIMPYMDSSQHPLDFQKEVIRLVLSILLADRQAEMVGQEAIAGAIGPMAKSARDMSLCIETILAGEPWRTDSSQVGMKWRPEEVTWKGGDKPRIGVMWNDGVVVPQAPMRTALEETVKKLRGAGYEVVDYKPLKQAEAWDILVRLDLESY
jgi:hypothetical protein